MLQADATSPAGGGSVSENAMKRLLGRWLKIYEGEITLFLWTVALLFLVRSSGMILNNYAETAFLKRYGVEYLPIVNMINAFATFAVMGVLTALMTRFKDARLLAYLFVFCGGSVGALRLLIPYDIDLIYPVLFMLKAQYEVLQALLFWNLANDLFNTRQSKRIFPLVTAGGVIGLIISSFGTPFLAKTLTFDNLLWTYLGLCIAAAVVVKGMSSRFPALLVAGKKGKRIKKRSAMLEEIKNVLPMMKESVLLKVMIVLTLMPNVVIPIMNYQFNFAVNEQFATEGALVQFFGYFRGVLNIINLVILMFVGRIYGRWGLPVALMFHPFNYLMAFFAFLMRFDVFSAIYARMSTNILRTTINIPANAVLMGLFPESYRSLVRPFLRGTVVRIGLFVGSGLILLSEPLFHPRFLSLAAFPFVVAWIVGPFVLKKRYADILLDLVATNVLDLKTMEEKDIKGLFAEKRIRSQLAEFFLSADGKDALWYGRLMKTVSPQELDDLIVKKIQTVDDETKIALLDLLSSGAGARAEPVILKLYDPENTPLSRALVRTAGRMEGGDFRELFQNALETSIDLNVKACALGGLCRKAPEEYGAAVSAWLSSEQMETRKAGVVAAGTSKDSGFIRPLLALLENPDNAPLVPDMLRGLKKLQTPGLNRIASAYLSNPSETVRAAALEILEVSDEEALRHAVSLMGDSSDTVYALAKEKILSASYVDGTLLVESLGLPRRRIREGIFDLFQRLGIKNIDTYRFVRNQVEMGYRNLWEAETLKNLPETPERDLMIDHLLQEKTARLENCLRVLALQDPDGRMKILVRGVFSADARLRANSMEALEDFLDTALSKILFPLLEDTNVSQRLAAGRRLFSLPPVGREPWSLFPDLLTKPNWVSVMLALVLLRDAPPEAADLNGVQKLTDSKNVHIREMAGMIVTQNRKTADKKEGAMEQTITIPDKIFHLKGIEIFEGLSVSELAAVASVTEEMTFPAGEIVIREGDPGDTMYLIIEGEVSVIKDAGTETEFELDRIREGDYFGEMALFEDLVRSATIKTQAPSRFLVLDKGEFKEIVKEYPEIALHICKVLSRRLRKLHEKIRI